MNTVKTRRSVAAFVAFAALAIAPATMALAAPSEGGTPVESQSETMAPATEGAELPNADISLIDETRKATLFIHKYEGTPTGLVNDGTELTSAPERDAVEGVTFTITPVLTTDKTGRVDLSTNAGWAQAHNYYDNLALARNNLDTTGAVTVTTDENGLAKTGQLPLGLYYVQETSAPDGYTRAADFLVTLPMTEPTKRESWMYDIHVYPKNLFSSAEKTVVDQWSWTPGNGTATSNNLTYNIATSANPATQIVNPPAEGQPDPVETLGRYEIFDDLEARLTLAADGVKVALNNGTELTRETDSGAGKTTATNDYFLYVNGKLVTDATVPAGTGGDLVRIIFTDAGLRKMQTELTKATGAVATGVNTTITTTVNSMGEAGDKYGLVDNKATFIPDGGWAEQNEAPADPTVPTTPGDPADSDDPYNPGDSDTPGLPTNEPVSKYGDFRILKFAAEDKNTKLKDAVFAVYKGGLGDKCDKAQMTPTNLIRHGITTDVDGIATITGLQTSNFYDGKDVNEESQFLNYCLVETTAPEGYNLRAEPMSFHVKVAGGITEATLADQQIEVPNEATNLGNALPLTGGAGVGALSGLALLLGAGGVGYYLKNARRNDELDSEFDDEFDELDD